jgi:hypothetical protein
MFGCSPDLTTLVGELKLTVASALSERDDLAILDNKTGQLVCCCQPEGAVKRGNMSRSAPWPWWQKYTGENAHRIRELLRAVLDLHGYYGDPQTWLWRGQANAAYFLSPGIHTRLVSNKLDLDDHNVAAETSRVLERVRAAGLDRHEGLVLPDLALLALIQHHGAATPLLDVSLDPLVALYMAVVSPTSADQAKDGVLFAIRKPQTPSAAQAIHSFDTRTFADVYGSLNPAETVLYSAPDVSERLRIQRGHFLLGKVTSAPSAQVTMPLTLDPARTTSETWLAARMEGRGKPGSQPATSDIGVFRVPAQLKPAIQVWLEERTGLTTDFVYPTTWHQPHLEMFSKSHSRMARI